MSRKVAGIGRPRRHGLEKISFRDDVLFAKPAVSASDSGRIDVNGVDGADTPLLFKAQHVTRSKGNGGGDNLRIRNVRQTVNHLAIEQQTASTGTGVPPSDGGDAIEQGERLLDPPHVSSLMKAKKVTTAPSITVSTCCKVCVVDINRNHFVPISCLQRDGVVDAAAAKRCPSCRSSRLFRKSFHVLSETHFTVADQIGLQSGWPNSIAGTDGTTDEATSVSDEGWKSNAGR
jgi:hypothetical protein